MSMDSPKMCKATDTQTEIEFIEDILNDFEDYFLVLKSQNSVLTYDGQIIKLEKALWDTSPVLRTFSNEDDPVQVSGSQFAVQHLIDIHQMGEYPEKHTEILDLLGLAHQLKIVHVIRGCMECLIRTRRDPITGKMYQYINEPFPKDCNSENVLGYFDAICAMPIREQPMYFKELYRIAKHLRNEPDSMSKAIDIVRKTLAASVTDEISPLPVPFDCRSVPVAIAQGRDKILSTMIFYANTWMKVFVFGKHIEIPATGLKSFHVRYRDYVMFLDSENVLHFKSINDPEKNEIIQRNVVLLFPKEDHVFVVTAVNGIHKLRYWYKRELSTLYAGGFLTDFLDFNCGKKLLCLQKSSSIIGIYQLQTCAVNLVMNISTLSGIQNMYFFGDNLYIWKAHLNGIMSQCSAYHFNDAQVTMAMVHEVDQRGKKHVERMRRKEIAETMFELRCQEALVFKGVQPIPVCWNPKFIGISEIFLLPSVIEIPG